MKRYTQGFVHLLPILVLALAIPLFVWGIMKFNLDIRNRAASGEPTPTPVKISCRKDIDCPKGFTCVIGYCQPKPTPSSKPNNNPIISTNALPVGFINSNYSASIKGSDIDGDQLNFSISNLPEGLATGPCGFGPITTGGGKTNLECNISGSPKKIGYYKIYVVLTDNRGGKAAKYLYLSVASTPTARPTPTPTNQCPREEACPVSKQPNLLRSCHPVDTDGTTQDSLCNRTGRVETCGPATTKYCCPKAGGSWTKNMTACK